MGSGNIHNYGDRNPAVWVAGKEQKIVVSSGVNGNANFLVFPEKKYSLNTWIPIKISQRLVGDKFVFEAVIAGDTVISQTKDLPTELKDVKVFGGNPWYPPQEGKIKNLVLKTENDGVCVCNARQDTCGKGYPDYCPHCNDPYHPWGQLWCKEDGKIYPHGEIMPTEDRCSNCSCKNGKRRCIHDCNVISLPTTTKPIPPVRKEGEMCGIAGERWDEELKTGVPVNYGECAEGLTCVGNRENLPGVCRKFGRGYLPPEKCNDSCKRKIKSPVCGEDGKEYNDCTVKCAGVKVKCLGKCPCEGRKEGDACGRWTVSYGECAEGLTCVPNNTIAPGFCKKKGCHECNEKFHLPVCGTDGRQYDNLCLANCKGVAVQCNGECPCDKKERRLKDCTDKKWGEWCALCKNKTLACDGWCIHPPRPRTPNIYCQPQLDDCIGKKEGDDCLLCPQKISECSGECQMRTGTEPPISIVWCMPRKGCQCP